MLRWILALSLSGFASTAIALGYVVPITHSAQNVFWTLTALIAALLVPSFDAFETQAAQGESEDES